MSNKKLFEKVFFLFIFSEWVSHFFTLASKIRHSMNLESIYTLFTQKYYSSTFYFLKIKCCCAFYYSCYWCLFSRSITLSRSHLCHTYISIKIYERVNIFTHSLSLSISIFRFNFLLCVSILVLFIHLHTFRVW
jgi:hypothetical protein